MTSSKSPSASHQSYSGKYPVWIVFLLSTISTLLVTVFAMYYVHTKFGLASEKIGSLGGAFQGTVGVAAAIAGAIATIYLAKVAIDLGIESNKIAERQERNENPEYLRATEIHTQRNELVSCIHSIQYFTKNATHLAGIYAKGEKAMKADFELKKLNEDDYKNTLKEFASLKSNLFSCYFSRLDPEFSRLIVSINPFILNVIASNSSKNNDNKNGQKWLDSAYKTMKAIDDLKTNNGESIPQSQLLDILTGCDFMLDALNQSEVSTKENILTHLKVNSSNKTPTDVTESIAKLTVALEKNNY